MKFFIVSYPGGMFGEFFCFLISQDESFYRNYSCKDFTDLADEKNRFLFPNYLEHLNFNPKTYILDDAWPLSSTEIQGLEDKFVGKNVAIPTHWFDDNIGKCNLPSTGIRLYCKNKKHLVVSYILHWLKSHQFANYPWPSRILDLEKLANSNHPYKEKFRDYSENLDTYQNWEFLSYRYNILLNGKPNLEYYISRKFFHYAFRPKETHSQWTGVDIGNIMFGDRSELDKFCTQMNLNFPSDMISTYSQKNAELIYRDLGLDIKDPNFLRCWEQKLSNFLIDKV